MFVQRLTEVKKLIFTTPFTLRVSTALLSQLANFQSQGLLFLSGGIQESLGRRQIRLMTSFRQLHLKRKKYGLQILF